MKEISELRSVSRSVFRAVLFLVFFVLCAPPGNAIVLGDRPLVVEVTKSADGTDKFDILNLAEITGAEKTGNWIMKLQEESEEARIHYSNSVHFRFGKGFTTDEVQWICDMFVACKVYPLSVTVLVEERREVFKHNINGDNMMKIIRQRQIQREQKPNPEKGTHQGTASDGDKPSN